MSDARYPYTVIPQQQGNRADGASHVRQMAYRQPLIEWSQEPRPLASLVY